MAALHVSRDHWLAMRHVRHEAISYRIFSRAFFGRAALESTGIRVFVRSDSI